MQKNLRCFQLTPHSKSISWLGLACMDVDFIDRKPFENAWRDLQNCHKYPFCRYQKRYPLFPAAIPLSANLEKTSVTIGNYDCLALCFLHWISIEGKIYYLMASWGFLISKPVEGFSHGGTWVGAGEAGGRSLALSLSRSHFQTCVGILARGHLHRRRWSWRSTWAKL